MHAIETSDVKRIQLLINQGADVNHRCRFGITPLFLAIMAGHLDCVNVLIDHQVNIYQVSGSADWTPLMCAVHYNNEEIVLSLLRAKAIINQTDTIEHMNALMLAAKRGHSECLKILLEHGSPLNDQNHIGETALIKAAQNGHIKCLQLLIDYSANINVQDDYGLTALMHAAIGNVDCTKILIDAGANLELIDIWKNNALIRSLMVDLSLDSTCALLLIRAGCPLNEVNDSGDTALFIAVRDDNINVIKELIERGANVNQCVNNRTALWYAANNSFHDSVKVLLDAEADPNIGEPPLVQAARYSSVDCVKMILNSGANINCVDPHLGTMILMGGYVGKREIIEIALNTGAEINTSPMSFYMPIIYNEQALMLLFAAGEDTAYFNYSQDAPETIVQTRQDFSLQNLSRIAIRNHLIVTRKNVDLFRLVKALPIPRVMKNYLLHDVHC